MAHWRRQRLGSSRGRQSPFGARTALFDYIEAFYNRQRRHSALDYLSPADFEALAA